MPRSCPLPTPVATDDPEVFLICDEITHRIYTMRPGGLATDEFCNQWRMTESGWEPWGIQRP